MQLATRLLTFFGVVVLAIALAGCPDRTADQAADMPPPQPPIAGPPGEPDLDATEGELRTVVLDATGMH
jgi:hypothetical protein